MSDNLKVAKECGATELGDQSYYTGLEWKDCPRLVFSGDVLEAYTSRILASQQAAHEAEIKELREFASGIEALLTPSDSVSIDGNERLSHILASIKDAIHKQQAAHDAEIARLKEENKKLRMEQFDLLAANIEANAACAMKDATMLDACALISEFVEDGNEAKRGEYRDILRALRTARTISPQQVSEWERKKLEPLRAQVTALVEALKNAMRMLGGNTSQVEFEILSNTQAAADQFIAECEQRGAADMCDWLADNPPRTLGMWSHMELHDKADELRATSKKAG